MKELRVLKRAVPSIALVAAFATEGCAPRETPPPERPENAPSIVLITVDTLRADHLGCYGYFRDTSPVIDALAAEGLLFENVSTTMSTTLPAHTSLLTSSYPSRNGVLANFNVWEQSAPTDSGGLRSVAQLLSDVRYRTAAFVSVFHLGTGSGVDAGFQTVDGVIADIGGAKLGDGKKLGLTERDLNTRRADVTTDRAIAWLDAGGTEPFFLWVHYFDPHSPYEAPPPYWDRFVTDGEVFPDARSKILRRTSRYDEEILFTDAQIGRLFDALRRLGLYDDAMVVLTADHGEGLGEHGVPEHGPIWEEQVRIPLILKYPAGTGPVGERTSRLTSIIDVFPIVLEAAGLPLDTSAFDGMDTLAEERKWVLLEREHTRTRFGTDVNYALSDGEWKYVLHTEKSDQLFHLGRDPDELENLIDERPEVARTMREELLRIVDENLERGEGLTLKRDVPPELSEALHSLGYVE